MSFNNAKSMAIEEIGTLNAILEFSNAWAFFAGRNEHSSDVVIMKGSGKKMPYSAFRMEYLPDEEPKKIL